MADPTGPKMLAGKHIVRVHLLDNSLKTLLVDEDATVQVLWGLRARCAARRCVDPASAVQAVCDMMAEKLEIGARALVVPCFSLHECMDGVTSASRRRRRRRRRARARGRPRL